MVVLESRCIGAGQTGRTTGEAGLNDTFNSPQCVLHAKSQCAGRTMALVRVAMMSTGVYMACKGLGN